MGENQIEQFQIKSRRILMSFYENEEILKKKKTLRGILTWINNNFYIICSFLIYLYITT